MMNDGKQTHIGSLRWIVVNENMSIVKHLFILKRRIE